MAKTERRTRADPWRLRITGRGTVAPGTLQAHPQNWREHPKAQARALASVLDEVGWVQQVVVNRTTGHVVDGHLRVQLAVERGEPKIPVVYVELTEAEEATILATLDPLAGMATTNQGKLAELLAAASLSDQALREHLGKLAGLTSSRRGGRTDPEAVPEVRRTSIRPGDLFELGAHRLLVGDTTDPADVDRLLAGDAVDMVWTDPPYAIYGSSTGIGSDIADDKMVRPFFLEVLSVSVQRVKEFGHIYVACDWRSWPSWWEMAKRAGATPKNLIVWDKGGSGLGSSYANTYELIGFFARLPKQKVMTSSEKRGQRQVYASNIIRCNRVPATEREHNAAKPVELITQQIELSSDAGQTVVDWFSGSGSTLIAAEQAGRRCLTMEIDPRYAQVTLDRWEAFSGERAKKVADGKETKTNGRAQARKQSRQAAAERRRASGRRRAAEMSVAPEG